MSLISDIQAKVSAALAKYGTPIKIAFVGGGNKSTMGILTATTMEDLQDTEIVSTDKTLYVSGDIGIAISPGDVITFTKSKNDYTVLKVFAYNIDDVTANNLAVKLFVRP